MRRGTHALVFACRHSARKHQRFSPSAERAKKRANARPTWADRRKHFLSYFGLTRRDIPKRLGKLVGSAGCHCVLDPDWTIGTASRVILPNLHGPLGIRSRNRVLERLPSQLRIASAGNSITGRRVLFAVLFAATMAGSLALAAWALSPGGIGVIDLVLLALFAMHAAVDGGGILERNNRIFDYAFFR